MSLKNTKLISGLLFLLATIFGVFGVTNKIFSLFSAISGVVLLTLVIYFLDKEDFEERFIWPLHGFALHALIFGVSMLFFGVDGGMFSRWYHAILDALVVASMLRLMKQKTLVIALCAIATGILSLVNLQIVVQLIFCLLAVVSLITVVKGFDEVSDLGYLAVLVIVFFLEKLFNIGNIEYWYHLLFNLFGLLLAILLLKENKNKVILRSNVAQVIDVEDVDEASAVEENAANDLSQFTRDWLVERYSKASLEDIYNAPISVFKGVGDIMANKMDESFQIKSVKDLANNDFFKWAKEILKELQ